MLEYVQNVIHGHGVCCGSPIDSAGFFPNSAFSPLRHLAEAVGWRIPMDEVLAGRIRELTRLLKEES